jgi:hypothetical protein
MKSRSSGIIYVITSTARRKLILVVKLVSEFVRLRAVVFYFFLPDPNVGCQPTAVPFWLGAAAIVLVFSFFGFFDSRLPFCSRLAMTFSLVR